MKLRPLDIRDRRLSRRKEGAEIIKFSGINQRVFLFTESGPAWRRLCDCRCAANLEFAKGTGVWNDYLWLWKFKIAVSEVPVYWMKVYRILRRTGQDLSHGCGNMLLTSHAIHEHVKCQRLYLEKKSTGLPILIQSFLNLSFQKQGKRVKGTLIKT